MHGGRTSLSFGPPKLKKLPKIYIFYEVYLQKLILSPQFLFLFIYLFIFSSAPHTKIPTSASAVGNAHGHFYSN
jgi:hypothetical protein